MSSNKLECAESDAPVLKKSKSSLENATVERYNQSLAAWRAGKFNSPERDKALVEFFSKSLIYDVRSDDGSKVYRYGFGDIQEFFEWSKEFDYAYMKSTVVPGGTPNEIWHLLEADACKHKETGKSAPLSRLIVASFEGGKIVRAMSKVLRDDDAQGPAGRMRRGGRALVGAGRVSGARSKRVSPVP